MPAKLTIDCTSGEVMYDCLPVTLTRLELALLVALATTPHQLQSHAYLCEVTGIRYGSNNSLRIHLNNLRAKLGDRQPFQLVVTGRGRGVFLNLQADQVELIGSPWRIIKHPELIPIICPHCKLGFFPEDAL